jgi:hypothetical protein
MLVTFRVAVAVVCIFADTVAESESDRNADVIHHIVGIPW